MNLYFKIKEFVRNHYLVTPVFVISLFVTLWFLYPYIIKWGYSRCISDYEFINNRVICDESPVIDKAGYALTQKVIEDYLDEEKRNKRINEGAVYFRDLSNGPIFGVNETEEFAPASLLKLPLALVYFKIAENKPEILDESIYFRESYDLQGQNFVSTDVIKPGREYKIVELIKSMLANSDNDAYMVLYEYLEKNGLVSKIRETYLELGILAPDDAFDEIISVRRYASIFRALYNVSYVEPKYSEMILAWLTGTSFKSGLNGGNFGDVKVSHKFGERFAEDGTKQLHDCGIFYYPKNPYLLCIMTKGDNFEVLSAIIRHISDLVYKEVESRKL